ncbi:hypothetical protein P9112_001625 [Eukaryota sp. TZLM1-RC]
MSFEEHVYSVITASLDPSSHQQAEESILNLDKTNDAFALALCKIVENTSIDINHRVAAAVQLHKTLSTHYDSAVNNFLPPAIPETHKSFIRISLIRSIASPNTILRTNVARSLSRVISLEYPEIWPSVPSILAHGLSPQTSTQPLPAELCEAFQTTSLLSLTSEQLHYLAHGFAMVTSSIAGDVADNKITTVLGVLMPALHDVIKPRLSFTSELDLEFCLYVLSALNSLLTVASYFVQDDTSHYVSVDEKRSPKIQQIIAPLIIPWLELLGKILQSNLIDPNQSVDVILSSVERGSLAPLIQSIKIMTVIVQLFSKELVQANMISSVIDSILLIYRKCNSLYEAFYINPTEIFEVNTSLKDPEGEAQNLLTLIDSCQTFFNASILVSKSIRKSIKSKLFELIEITLLLLRMDRQSVIDWSISLDKYYASEDETTFDFTIRISAKLFMARLADNLPTTCFKQFTLVAGKLFGQSQELRGRSEDFSWIVLMESVFCGFSCILPAVSEIPKDFDWSGFVNALGSTFELQTSSNALPFLQICALSCLSESIKFLPTSSIPEIASRIKNCLNPSTPPLITGLSLGSLVKFLEAVQDLDLMAGEKDTGNKPSKGVIKVFGSQLNDMFVTILKFLSCAKESSDALHIGVDCLQHLISLFSETQYLTSVATLITSACMDLWTKFPSDPLLIVGIIDCLTLSCKNEETGNLIMTNILPEVTKSLENSATDDVTLQTCIDLISSFLQPRQTSQNLPGVIFQTVYPRLCQLMLVTNDPQILQSGSECIRHYLRVASDVIQSLVFSVEIDGKSSQVNGVDVIFHVISKLLRPDMTEDAALFIGPLIIRVLRTFKSNLSQELLTSLVFGVLNRFKTAKIFAFQQGLLLVICHLSFIIPFENFLQILSSVPDGIDLFFKNFAEHHPNFFGSFDIKVALRFAMNMITIDDPRINNISVFGDSLEPLRTGVSTRAQRVAHRQSDREVVSLKAKLLKNIIAVFNDYVEDIKAPKHGYESDDDEAEDFDDQAEGNLTSESLFVDADEFGMLEQLIGEETVAGGGFNEDEFADEPLFQFEVVGIVGHFFKDLANKGILNVFSGCFSQKEKEIIQLALS